MLRVQETFFFFGERSRIKKVHVYHDREELKFLRENWEGPFVVKGISSTHARFILFLLFSAFQISELHLCSGCRKGTDLWRPWDRRIGEEIPSDKGSALDYLHLSLLNVSRRSICRR